MASSGDTVIISRAGVPVAQVIPFPSKVHRSGRGSLAGRLTLAEDWKSTEVSTAMAAEFGIDE